jgi:hypothetical protein
MPAALHPSSALNVHQHGQHDKPAALLRKKSGWTCTPQSAWVRGEWQYTWSTEYVLEMYSQIGDFRSIASVFLQWSASMMLATIVARTPEAPGVRVFFRIAAQVGSLFLPIHQQRMSRANNPQQRVSFGCIVSVT